MFLWDGGSQVKKRYFLYQRKFVLDLLKDVTMIGCKLCLIAIEAYHRLKEDCDKLIDVGRYKSLVGHLVYLSLTKLDITYAVGVISQFINASTQTHLEVSYRVFR